MPPSAAINCLLLFIAVFSFLGCGNKGAERIEGRTEKVQAESNEPQSTPVVIPAKPASKNNSAPVAAEPRGESAAESITKGSSEEGSIQPSTSEPPVANAVPVANAAPFVNDRLPRLRTAPADLVLAKHGLRRIESKRLVLITDSHDADLDKIPAIADQLFDALQAWFGKLAAAADGSEFQVLGHIMVDRAKFRAANLLPDESFTIRHGKHHRYAFWTGYPETAYYRRHLALHEFVHCFMTCETSVQDVPPLWYLEGMAELFGTHQVGTHQAQQINSAWQASFGTMPAQANGYEGWGRIRAFRKDFEAADHQQLSVQQIPSFDSVVPSLVDVFESPFQYSSSWAVCWFLKHHPDAGQVMPALAKQRSRIDFLSEWERQRNDFGQRLAVDWLLFAEQLDFGFDPERCFPVHLATADNAAVQSSSSSTFELASDRGWQNTGVELRRGESIEITCQGRCTLNETAQPWISSPSGISIEYYRGHRIGRVVAVLVSKQGNRITDRLKVGSAATVTADFDGQVWLQVNDASDDRANNSGAYQVQYEWSK